MIEVLGQPDKRVVNTAVISLAGLGTRMSPFTRDNPKFMAPIYESEGAIPNIDYTLYDLLDVEDINRFVFVVNSDSDGEERMRKHLGAMNSRREAALRSKNKLEQLESESRLEALFADKELLFVEQDVDGKYGTAVAVDLALQKVEDDGYVTVYGGDDFFWDPSGRSQLAMAVADWQASGVENAIIGKPVRREDGPRYGILKTNGRLLERSVEKPPLEALPVDEDPFANVSRYLLHVASLREGLGEYMMQPSPNANGEFYFTDVMNGMVANGHDTLVVPAKNMYFDAGTVESIGAAGPAITKARAAYAT